MVNRSNLQIFWLQWIAANTFSLGIGFLLIKFIVKSQFEESLGFSSPDLLTCIIVAVLMGISQWLVLKNRISRFHHLWIVTSVVGLPICAYLVYILQGLTFLVLLRTPLSFMQEVKLISINALKGGFIGGLFIGIAQFLVFEKWKSWILVNGIAWSFAWAVALAISKIVKALLYIKFNIADLSMPIELMMFGSILGFISSLFTGTYLVWLLKRADI
jgi:hypothetical protein